MLKPGAPYHASCWQRTAGEAREVETTHDIQNVVQVPAMQMFIWNLIECKTLHPHMPQLKVGVFTLKRRHDFHPEDAGILAFLLCHGAEVWRISTLPHYATVSWRNLVKSIAVIPEWPTSEGC